MVTPSTELLHRTWVDSWNAGRLDALDDLLAADFTPHSALNPVLGPEGVKQLIAGFHHAFPDLAFAIDDLIAAGDKYVVRWSLTGTHRADLLGLPPTGRRVSLTGISIYRLVNGCVIESWDEVDLFSLLQQVGVLSDL